MLRILLMPASLLVVSVVMLVVMPVVHAADAPAVKPVLPMVSIPHTLSGAPAASHHPHAASSAQLPGEDWVYRAGYSPRRGTVGVKT